MPLCWCLTYIRSTAVDSVVSCLPGCVAYAVCNSPAYHPGCLHPVGHTSYFAELPFRSTTFRLNYADPDCVTCGTVRGSPCWFAFGSVWTVGRHAFPTLTLFMRCMRCPRDAPTVPVHFPIYTDPTPGSGAPDRLLRTAGSVKHGHPELFG